MKNKMQVLCPTYTTKSQNIYSYVLIIFKLTIIAGYEYTYYLHE